MKSITAQLHVGADGILRLQMPVNWTDVDLEVTVIMQPIAPARPIDLLRAKDNGGRNRPTPEELGWPSWFFTEVVGGWKGEPLIREPQGEYEAREGLE